MRAQHLDRAGWPSDERPAVAEVDARGACAMLLHSGRSVVFVWCGTGWHSPDGRPARDDNRHCVLRPVIGGLHSTLRLHSAAVRWSRPAEAGGCCSARVCAREFAYARDRRCVAVLVLGKRGALEPNCGLGAGKPFVLVSSTSIGVCAHQCGSTNGCLRPTLWFGQQSSAAGAAPCDTVVRGIREEACKMPRISRFGFACLSRN